MIQKHKNPEKYIGQGVVYVDDKGSWRRMTIIEVFESADVNGKHLKFNLTERLRGKVKDRLYKWYYAEVKGVSETSLYSNPTVYFSELKKKLENQIDGIKFQMKDLERKMENATSHMQNVSKTMYERFISKYKDKPYTPSCFNDFLNESREMAERHASECKSWNLAKAEYEKCKAELAELNKTLHRITRKERSKQIQKEWRENQKIQKEPDENQNPSYDFLTTNQ